MYVHEGQAAGLVIMEYIEPPYKLLVRSFVLSKSGYES